MTRSSIAEYTNKTVNKIEGNRAKARRIFIPAMAFFFTGMLVSINAFSGVMAGRNTAYLWDIHPLIFAAISVIGFMSSFVLSCFASRTLNPY